MSHIHTEPGEHDLTASAYIIRVDLGEPAIFLHKHRVLKKWLQFGGHVEIKENPWQAIARELHEEVGYEMSQLTLLQPDLPAVEFTNAVVHPVPATTLTVQYGDLDHLHTDLAYAFTASEPPGQKIGKDESDVLRAFTVAELKNLSDDEIPTNVRELCIYLIETILKSWKPTPADSWKTALL